MSDIDDDEKDRSDGELEMIRAITRRLREHFDTVQILCTRAVEGKDDGTVIRFSYGAGHIMARTEHARFFVRQQDKDDD